MDIALEIYDTYLFDDLYAKLLPSKYIHRYVTNNSTLDSLESIPQWQFRPASSLETFSPRDAALSSLWNRDNIYRQAISLFIITWISGAAVYFIFSSLSYVFVFDKTTYKHPKFLKNQVRMEISQAVRSMPIICLLTTPFFLAEVRGYSRLYNSFSDEPIPYYNWIQFPLFLFFTDFCIYWIHRGLHHPLIYKKIHKPHHKWIMPSPYASVAFHPLDGWAQSLPYHIFPFIFPLQKFAYLCLFFFVQIWTVLIHDGEYVSNSPILNGAACHTMHHLYFNYNYGQYTTLWDRIGGSYRKPNSELFNAESKMAQREWEKQVKELEHTLKEIEGEDHENYDAEEKKKL
ncbi:ERG3/sterol delta 5,6-desaturase [Blumeria hordei DH14]|uniref:ERG3/sterol delta 5,6-desaturase n=1 Tax=Blumeria graminis f. sp. hordei (strain DH14) TaxID=546991 RepID=N1JH33_BLUG1|nr:ERG3/sterol delta 5,6-desaturase [Blumeria hordei DH14]